MNRTVQVSKWWKQGKMASLIFAFLTNLAKKTKQEKRQGLELRRFASTEATW